MKISHSNLPHRTMEHKTKPYCISDEVDANVRCSFRYKMLSAVTSAALYVNWIDSSAIFKTIIFCCR